MPCEKCKMDFVTRDVVVKCVECEIAFHSACARNFTKTRSKSWKCESCKDDNVSNASGKSSDEPPIGAILEAINAVKKDLGAIDAKIVGLQGSMDSMKFDIKSLSDKVEAIDVKHEVLQKRCEKLQQDNAALEDEMKHLRMQVLDLEQHSRCANLEILGVPVTEEENMSALLSSVAKAINVPYKHEDVSIAHRLRLFSKKHTHAPIIIQFVSRSTKELWLRASRQKKNLRASEVSRSFPASAMFINEHLTSNNKALLGRARRLFRERKVHFAGFVNGKVLVKPREGEDAVRVLQMGDLDRFDKR